ncbi:MAG: transcription/translation regulatory transformer protein RfaH [Aquisalimonadaceae bacterium]
MRHWYAAYCKPRQDARAEIHLLNQRFDVFRPLVRVRRFRRGKPCQVKESMFPRYLFIQLDDLDENWGPIRSTRGISGLVHWGDHVPVVPDRVIQRLYGDLAEDGCVDLAGTDDYKLNERIRITAGPFAGYEALYQARSSEERVIVLLEIMQRDQRLVLPGDSIARA